MSEIVESLILAATRDLKQGRRWWIVSHATTRAANHVLALGWLS